MQFTSAVTSASDVGQAIDELLEPIDAFLTPGMADLVFLFATAHFEDDLPDVVDRLGASFPTAAIMGCTAEGTIGCDQELQGTPSMALLVGVLPGVLVRPFRVQQDLLESARSVFDWERVFGVSPDSDPVFIAFGDPFRINIPAFVEQLNELFPGAPLVGGVASAAHAPDQNRLILAGEIHRDGLVGVALTGNLTVDTVVSQGCRPIGKPFVITKGERNVVYELGGRAALQQLHSVLVGLSPRDEQLARQSLLVGRVIDERKEVFSRGDFLIQNIVGVDRGSGAMGITGNARVGTTLQFHVRDADSADEDLRTLLAPHQILNVRGALLFGCTGRGIHMWKKSGHDVGVLRDLLGEIPVAGFFCGGEFGPIGGRNYIHGFTASIALLSELDDDDARQTDQQL
ncbi:MAG: FIST C-terminal domain-containing protein [Phycisphaerales bacterium]|nr:MAG: FIST C-terminal domain-containing protein [Phycisphaerales bacterium]